MRLVKISLGKDTPFWFLGGIQLTEKNKETGLIDVDILTEEDKRTINASARTGSIRLWDITNQRIPSIDNEVLTKTTYPIDTEDLDSEEIDLIPEIATVTISETPIQQFAIEDLSPSEEDVKDAKILIERNGNTIKKIVLSMEPKKKNLRILVAAEELEQKGKNRSGILSSLRETIDRWQDGRVD